MRIAYIFPSRTRPTKFFQCLENIQDQSFQDNYFVWAKLDLDDPFKEEYEKRLHEFPEVTVKWGLSKNKIHAINRDLEDLPPCDIMIIQSDDIHWSAFAFDDEIREAFEKHFPDLSGTVHFPEKNAGNRTIIVSMLGINLYKQLGYMYHPDYESLYSDNDFTEMTRMMKKYAYVNKQIFLHKHPIWKESGTDWDSQYRHTERPEVYKKDHETYIARKAKNFGV